MIVEFRTINFLLFFKACIKPGTMEHGTAERGKQEHQIWNSKTRNTKFGPPNLECESLEHQNTEPHVPNLIVEM